MPAPLARRQLSWMEPPFSTIRTRLSAVSVRRATLTTQLATVSILRTEQKRLRIPPGCYGLQTQFCKPLLDLDRANGNGSDLGFEVVNDRAFVPGVAGYSGPLGLQFAVSADGKGLEFGIPDAFFTGQFLA